jgi:hypothetical protein
MSRTANLGDPDNGHTLEDLKVKPAEILAVFKKSALSQKKAFIVMDDEKTGEAVLTFRAKQAAAEIFGRFATENEGGVRVINLESLVSFTKIATDGASSPDDPAIKSFIASYGLEGKDEIPLEGIEKFFVQACTTGQDLTLRKNLERFGYG